MGNGGRTGQRRGAHSGAQTGPAPDSPLRLREVPGILLAVLALALAVGGSALVVHLALGISWLASVAAAPLLLMVATAVWNAVRTRPAASGEVIVERAWTSPRSALQPAYGVRRLWRGRTGSL